MLDVERQALLRAVGPDEVRGQAAHALVVAAREVADAGTLDLDDAGAEVGELAGGERRGDGVLAGDDGDSVQGLHNRIIPRHPSGGLLPGRAHGPRHAPGNPRTPASRPFSPVEAPAFRGPALHRAHRSTLAEAP